ncbi:MAG: hypothetical protein R3F03_03975 [Opitutaceae bacterium]
MAPLALPPGPYFEQLVANGLLSYTDAFNYHYYGYAEDFTGAYWQFHDAVTASSAASEVRGTRSMEPSRSSRQKSASPLQPPSSVWLHAPRSSLIAQNSGFKFPVSDSSNLAPSDQRLVSPELVERAPNSGFKFPVSGLPKSLPVLLTEYGYPSLGRADRNTVDGRLRQWAWFKNVGEQIRDLRIAGPMAFYLPPYFEREMHEFGLSVRPAHVAIGDKLKAISREITDTAHSELPAPRSPLPAAGPKFMAGGLTFRLEDFGATKAEPWMRHIGRKFGNNEATPALAWLFEAGKRRYTPRDWTVTVPLPSPVVMDFVAGDGTRQVKRFGGYFATQMTWISSAQPNAGETTPNSDLPPPVSDSTNLASSSHLLVSGSAPAPSSGLRSQVSGFSSPVVSSAAHKAPASVTPPLRSRARPEVAPSPPLGSVLASSSQLLATSLQSFATCRGTIVLYNFADTTITGRIAVTAGRDLLADPEALERMQVLTPMCRIEIPIQVRIPAKEFSKHPLSLRFVPEVDNPAPLVAPKSDVGGSSTLSAPRSGLRPRSEVPLQVSGFRSPVCSSVFSTAFFPDPGATGMRADALFDFTAVTALATSPKRPVANNAELLASRPVAVGEPRLQPQAGTPWRVTPGVEVTTAPDDVWRFRINHFPDEPLRPAMAELPLPDDFVFPDGALMQFRYRLVELGGGGMEAGAYFEPYFRTANGNLYQVWPRQLAKPQWRPYTELKENYTMAFYGRTNLPWRFRENRIVALVFFFRPTAFPAVYEVKSPRLVRFTSH